MCKNSTLINKKFKIAVFSMGVKLNGEPGYTRFNSVAETLTKHGFEVDLITTTFQHWEKKQRVMEQLDLTAYPYEIKFVYEPGYKKNIDLKRIYSHRILSKNVKNYLQDNNQYDLIYTEIPPNNVARVIAEFANKYQIPLVVDVNDLWPEAMKMVIDIPFFNNLLFKKFEKDAEKVYELANGIIGTSEEYANRPFKNKKNKALKEIVYVGNDIDYFDTCIVNSKKEIEKNEYWVTYAGTLGKSYDIKTLIEAGTCLLEKGFDNIKILILGGDPLEDEFKEYAKNHNCNVEFLGYLPYEEMACYLSKSDIVVNSVVKKSAASIITKIGDYLASDSPMINTCSSIEFRHKVESNKFGLNVEAENCKELADAIEYIYRNPEMSKIMASNGRKIAEQEFNRKISYLKIVNVCNILLKGE